jgi:hypothetical protein
MNKKNAWRNIIVLCACGGLLALASHASAQFGTNAPPCPSHCTPASPWWGYVQTHWTRWPGATYPDMLKAPGTSGEEIPVPGVDLPNPSKESEIRSVPTTGNTKSPVTGPGTQEAPGETPTEPTPAKPFSEPKQNELPSVKEAPGATPPSDEPFFTPPNTPSNAPPLPAEPGPAAPANSSSMVPRPRLHAPISKPYAANVDNNDWYNQRESRSDIADAVAAKPLRLRIDVDDFSQPLPGEQESAQVTSSSAGRTIAHNAATTNQRSVASGNPLRTDFGTAGVVAASATSSDSRSGAAYTSDSTPDSNAQATYQR